MNQPTPPAKPSVRAPGESLSRDTYTTGKDGQPVPRRSGPLPPPRRQTPPAK